MTIDLRGKTAIVTGSSAGIGLASAKALAKAGASVILTGRTERALQKAREQIIAEATGADVRLHAADLSTAQGVSSLREGEPMCDILVNNVGNKWSPKNFFETPDDAWELAFRTGIMPGVRCSRAYLEGMMQRGWGRVIFISSVDAIVVPTDSLDYAYARAAVLNLARGLAKVAGATGVTVNTLLASPTMTEWLADTLKQMMPRDSQDLNAFGREVVQKRYPTSLDGRIHSLDEVSNLVVCLSSDLYSAVTGTVLRADGGIVESLA